MPGRSWKVYVRPPSVGAGNEVARSGTGCVPARPLTWLNAVRPSPVIRRSGETYVYIETAESMESMESASPFFLGPLVRSTSVPPRWPAPECGTATSTASPDIASPDTRLPTLTRCATWFLPGSMRTTLPSNWLLTQMPRGSTATASGPFPVRTVAVTEFVLGSIRETVPSRLFATHAAPWPKAIPVGPFPTWIGAKTCFPVVGSMRTTWPAARWLAHRVPAPNASSVAATDSVVGLPLSESIRVIVPSPVFATQTEPAAWTIPSGPTPTPIFWTTVFVPGSIRETVPSRLLTTQTAPSPVAIPLGPLPTGIVSTTAFVPGSIRETEWPSALVTQYAPSPAATAVGVAPTAVAATRRPERASTTPSESPAAETAGRPPLPP